MKKMVLTLGIGLLFITSTYAQENNKIAVKGDLIQMDMKCTTAYRNFHGFGKEYVEIDKALIRKNSILSIVVNNNEVIITTTELSWANSTNISKHYAFKFSDSDACNRFYSGLIDTIAID